MTGVAMVKKPGDQQWVPLTPATTVQYQHVVQVRCPDGRNDNLARVFPE